MGIKKPLVLEVAHRTYAINEFGMATCFLLWGTERGLLIDTGCGMYNIREIADELCPLPYDVVITHSHGDHYGYMDAWDEVWIHPDDIPNLTDEKLAAWKNRPTTYLDMMATFGTTEAYEVTQEQCHHPEHAPRLIPCPEGTVFDLGGGRKVDVIHTPGHSRFDPRDPLSLDHPARDFTALMRKSIRGWRIAYTPDFGVFPVEREVLKTVERAAKRFEELGAIVEPVEFHLTQSANQLAEAWCRSICVDTAIELELDRRRGFDLVRDHRDELPEEFICWNEQTAKGGILDYYAFNRTRTELFDAVQDVFERYDLILSPTTSCLPVLNAADRNTTGPGEVNGVPVEPLIGFCQTFFFNFTGHPAASVPAGLSKTGLPIGMQIAGRRFRDEDVLAAATAFEDAQPWRRQYEIPFSRSI